MSQSYPQFPGTSFPDKIDAFPKIMDVTAQYESLAKQWAGLVERGNLAEAAQLLQAYPELDRMVINAAKINRLTDSVMAMETFFMQEVNTYFVNVIEYKGVWNSSTRYNKFNIVTYVVNGTTQSYMAIVSDVPLGAVPTNTNYWALVTQGVKGDKGDTGPAGPQGEKGDTGAAGPAGPKGDTGDTGSTGPAGPQGAKGDKGDKGDTGPQGPQGEKGEKGDTGEQGIPGISFVYRGEWDSSITYGKDQAVTWNNSLWVTKHDGVTSEPNLENSRDWTLVLTGIGDGGNKIILPIPSQRGTLTYNKLVQYPSWNNYDSTTTSISGQTFATNAGTYEAIFTPAANCMWEDGTSGARPVSWTIERQVITVAPSMEEELIYNGSSQSPTWKDYDADKYTVSGTTEATNAGKYQTTFTTTDNYILDIDESGNTTELVKLPIPAQANSLTENGAQQSPTWTNYDASKLTIGGTTQAKDAGVYYASFTPKTGYCWNDGSTGSKQVPWSIHEGNTTIQSVPSPKSMPIYRGYEVSPTWEDYDADQVTVSGDITGLNAGTYTTIFTPRDGYAWVDGTTTPKSVTWEIQKNQYKIIIDPYENTYTYGDDVLPRVTSDTINRIIFKDNDDVDGLALPIVSSIFGGSIEDNTISSVTSSDESVATIERMPYASGSSTTRVEMTPKKAGTALITLHKNGDQNYLPTDPDCIITYNVRKSNLITDSAATFKANIANGSGPSKYAVGDRVKVALDGTVVDEPISGTYCPWILGFNHNKPYEGTGNYADLEFGTTLDGTKIAFCHNYGKSCYSAQGIYGYAYKLSDPNNTGDYMGFYDYCYINTDVMPQFLEIMESAWRNVIKTTKKMPTTDAVEGAGQYTLWLPSSVEIGAIEPTLGEDQSNQKMYDFYKNGTNDWRYAHNDLTKEVQFWGRSYASRNSAPSRAYNPYYVTTAPYQKFYWYTRSTTDFLHVSRGLAPCFRVG